MTRTKRDLILLLFFTFLCLLPFVNKPFNVDDPFYLKMAEQIQKDPIRPYSFSINWSGETRDVWARMEATFPPLIPYYIAGVGALFGMNEITLHLFFLVFPLVSAVSMYMLLKKYVKNPLVYSFIFVSAPAFLVSSNSIMLDVPLTAFMLSSAAFFIYGVDRGKDSYVLAGSVLSGFAVMTKYSAIIGVAVLGIYVLLSEKRKYFVYLLIPVAFFGLWCIHNLAMYGEAHFFKASSHVGKGLTPHKIIAFLPFFSGCLVFPMFAFFRLDIREKLVSVILSAIFFVVAEKLQLLRGGPATLTYTVLLAATSVFVYEVIKHRVEADKFIFAWLLIASFLVLTVEPWVSGRYILFMLPPALIIFAQSNERLAGAAKYVSAGAALALTLYFGISLGIADYIWARSYPGIPEYLKSKEITSGYFLGHFGFQYYMEKSGFSALEVRDEVSGPSFIIAAKMPDPQKPAGGTFSKMELIDHQRIDSAFPLRVMSPKDHAGFYSSFWGILPFAAAGTPVEEFAVFRLKK
ncbi:MAG: glycosyltransferase family 39 protein [Elusimicrobiota bacterium]